MKRKFPILLKVTLLGIGVSILTAGTGVVFSYINQKKRAEETMVHNVDNSLDEAEYTFLGHKDYLDYTNDILAVREYVMGVYDEDPDKTQLQDYATFEEYEEHYKELYPWIHANGTAILFPALAAFRKSYSLVFSILTSCQLSSGSVSAFMAYSNVADRRFVMLVDSRMNKTPPENPFYHLPGSYYQPKDGDYIVHNPNESHDGYYLNGHTTRFINLYGEEDQNGETVKVYLATVFIEYDLRLVDAETMNILNKELLVIGLSSLALIIMYAIFSYFLFVRNINKLSKASMLVREKLANKNMDEVVETHIKANDEIKTLADSFTAMEQEIINYVNIIHQEAVLKERTNAELAVASKIQLDTLPDEEFEDNNASIRAFIKTAKEVGGDFYDYFYLDDHRLALIVSDVSGKGVPASLFMMKGKELIKSAVMSYPSLKDAIKGVNTMLARNNKELLFITSFIGIVDLNKNEITYINAGHEKPYIISPKGITKLDGESNIVLGVEERYEFKEESHKFNKGDYIFMFTDGLNESINSVNEEFGYQRIEDILNNSHTLPLEEIVQLINKNLDEFTSGEEQFDDVTMLIMKNKDNKLKLHFEKKDYSIIDEIVDAFSKEYASLPEETRSSVGIIVDEIVNNLVSYEKRDDLVVDVEFALSKKGLEITIVSNGENYDPFANHKEKYLDKYHTEIELGGFGLSIVKSLSKSHSYEYKDGHPIIKVLLK